MQTHLEDKTYLTVNSNGEISIDRISEEKNSTPINVYTNKTLRFKIPSNVSDQTIEEAIDELKLYFERLHQGHLYENGKWILTQDSKEVSYLIEEHLLNLPIEFIE
ncbi:hypothetical protein [Leptospira noguchii]|uniref:Uncharacterized protein n=1 Tax=Leptospira noguchii TaxID=28182 RepID=M6VYW8_9LEPT|nr:hypothetical protein [Leptospira noguchii]EMO54738.1 hypothetical protein LEP1GSC172_4314 [Leptospira noguchii]